MSRYGRRPRTWDQRDFIARPSARYTGDYIDLEGGMPPIWDQGNLGACVAFGACAALAFARHLQGLPTLDPSRLFTYYAARARAGYPLDQDTGLEVRDGFASLAHDGVPPSDDWPYLVDRFADRPPDSAFTDASRDEAVVYGAVAPGAVDDVIASGYPVVIGFDVYESFESQRTADTGVMPVPTKAEQLVGGHCVALVSTPKPGADIPGGVPGVLYRRARNSWGTGWGDRGWFWFPDPAMRYASDFWQVTTVSAFDPPVPPPVSPDARVADEADIALANALHRGDWVHRPHLLRAAREIARVAREVWLPARGL